MNRPALAKEILDNELFQNIIEQFRLRLFDMWATADSAEAREDIFRQLQAVTNLVNEINNTLLEYINE